MAAQGTTGTRAVAYIRVSTEDQAQEGVSLEAQWARVELYAHQHGLELIEIVEGAGESAKTLDRPGLRRALDLLRTADVLLIPTLDRLTRSVRDWATLREEHFADRLLVSAGEHVDVTTASGRFVLHILFAKAEFERDQIGERTATALQHKAGKGEYTGGGARYGFRVIECADGQADRVEPVPAEQAVIKEALRLKAEGKSLRQIATALAAACHLSRAGTPFQPGQLKRILDSAALPPNPPQSATPRS